MPSSWQSVGGDSDIEKCTTEFSHDQNPSDTFAAGAGMSHDISISVQNNWNFSPYYHSNNNEQQQILPQFTNSFTSMHHQFCGTEDAKFNLPDDVEFYTNADDFNLPNSGMATVLQPSHMLPLLATHRSTIDPSLILMSQPLELYPTPTASFGSFCSMPSWTEENLFVRAGNIALPSNFSDSGSQFDKLFTPPLDIAPDSPEADKMVDHSSWYPSPEQFKNSEAVWGDSDEMDRSESPASDYKYSSVKTTDSVLFESPPHLDPMVANATAARRQWEDNFIVEGRTKGWTYKDIISKGGFKCAESTIRGRYRSIVKPKCERLRRPIWKPIDERLLLDAVEKMSSKDRIRRVKARDNMQELAVVWLEISNYIKDHGGTYKFGPWTCKQKWMQLAGITE